MRTSSEAERVQSVSHPNKTSLSWLYCIYNVAKIAKLPA